VYSAKHREYQLVAKHSIWKSK